MKGADAIFKRFGNATGGIVELTPIDNLFVAATLYGQGGNNTTLKAEDVYKEIQVGAGYTLENLGQVRAQYIGAANTYAGGSPGVAAKEGIYVTPSTTPGAVGTQGVGFQLPTTGNPYWIVEPVKAGDATSSSIAGHRIQAAFALTAIDNLTVDLGGTIGLPFDVEDMTDVTANQGHGISLGANFAAGDFSVLGRADTTFGANAKYKSDKMYTSGFGLNALIEPSYNLGAVTVGADINLDFAGNSKVGMGSLVENKDGHFGFGFGLWLKKGLSNGYIQTGVALTLPQNNKDDTKGPLVVAIPIVLEYGF
jgi:hypothetical protein